MVDLALAGEFELTAILAVKAHPTLRQGNPELVLLGIPEFAKDRDFGAAAGIENVNGLGLHAARSEELDLLRLAVAE